jgi:hypothetical protein
MLDDGWQCLHGSVIEVFVVLIGEVEVSCRTAFATYLREVGCICVDCKDHVTSVVL